MRGWENESFLVKGGLYASLFNVQDDCLFVI